MHASIPSRNTVQSRVLRLWCPMIYGAMHQCHHCLSSLGAGPRTPPNSNRLWGTSNGLPTALHFVFLASYFGGNVMLGINKLKVTLFFINRWCEWHHNDDEVWQVAKELIKEIAHLDGRVFVVVCLFQCLNVIKPAFFTYFTLKIEIYIPLSLLKYWLDVIKMTGVSTQKTRSHNHHSPCESITHLNTCFSESWNSWK